MLVDPLKWILYSMYYSILFQDQLCIRRSSVTDMLLLMIRADTYEYFMPQSTYATEIRAISLEGWSTLFRISRTQ